MASTSQEEDDDKNFLQIGGGSSPLRHTAGSRTLEEQMALLSLMQQPQPKFSIQGGTLQDRLQLLQTQRAMDTKIKRFTTVEASQHQATSELIRDRLKWLETQGQSILQVTEKKPCILVQGGNLHDRLRLLEEQKKRDADRAISYTTPESQVTKELIQDRLKTLTEKQKDLVTQKQTISVEGGKLQDRLKLLEEQRQKDAQTVSYTTDPSLVTKELIHDRLKWIEEQKKKSTMTAAEREAIVVEGGKLQDRLKLLEEQRQKDAQTVSYTTDPSLVTKELIYDRLEWIEEQKKKSTMTAAEREEIFVEGGRLEDRLKLLEEQHKKDSAKLISFTTDLSKVTDDFIRKRLAWIEKQNKSINHLPETARSIISSDLVAERMAWLRKNAAKASELPEKERFEVSRDLVAQRQAWLDEAKIKVAQLPKKERVAVTRGLISERIAWLTAQKGEAASLSHADRTRMTRNLIAERLSWLQQQYAVNKSEDVEIQITFLSEQNESAEQMTEAEQIVMANALLDEKVQDLEIQKEMTSELTEEEQIEVTNLLIDDRQAWLEGDDHLIAREEKSSEVNPLDESTHTMQMIANSIAFWTEQKHCVPGLSAAEKSEIASFLILEHIENLEMLIEDASDTDKEGIEMQITFLRDQHEDIDNIDHLVMINALIDEKVADLRKQLAVLA